MSNLASNNIMVILDNQISKPGWCCSKCDDNGFFGDKYFDPDEWLRGLTMMATMFKNSTNVVGMSLRNELRGPKQNISLWYRYTDLIVLLMAWLFSFNWQNPSFSFTT